MIPAVNPPPQAHGAIYVAAPGGGGLPATAIVWGAGNGLEWGAGNTLKWG